MDKYNDEGDDPVVIREKELKHNVDRRATIKTLANKIADRNDEALRKLSKS